MWYVIGFFAACVAASITTPPVVRMRTVYTWSRTGNSGSKNPSREVGKAKEPGIYVSPEGAQFPAESLVLKTDWKKHQGPPAEHFARAKAHGYDFMP